MPDNITYDTSQLKLGLNLESIASDLRQGQWRYSLNAQISGFDGNSITIQNEEGNILCTNFPIPYKVVGALPVIEDALVVLWLATEDGLNSEIGTLNTNTCTYTKSINDPCIGLRLDKPILKPLYKKTTKGLEVYWTDNNQPLRYLNLSNPPYKEIFDGTICNSTILPEVDCNKLNIQPAFNIPQLSTNLQSGDGEMEAGTYQFGIQYANALSEAYTSVYSITNPIGVFDSTKITLDFNYKVNASIEVDVSNIDVTGYYDYFNLIVIKAVNNILTPYLVGTYQITGPTQKITYTGQNLLEEPLSLLDITEKFPVYTTADDATTAQDILIWKGLTVEERLSYQEIASKIKLQWETHKIKYSRMQKEPELFYKYRSTMRDEVYPYEICFLLKRGTQTDGFHIPGRLPISSDLLTSPHINDVVEEDYEDCNPDTSVPLIWKTYNTASNLGKTTEYLNFLGNVDCYEGSYEYGDFAYWESEEKYPCEQNIWGSLSNQPIRHHKFPDNIVSSIYDQDGYVYPIGVRIDVEQIKNLILQSSLTQEQKDNITGFKILRGNRSTNKSVVAKGLIHNVLKYTTLDGYINIPPDNDNSSTSPEASIINLVNRAISLTQSAILETTTPSYTSLLQQAVSDLTAAKNWPIGSTQFNSLVQSAENNINTVLANPDSTAQQTYLQSAADTINSLQQAVISYQQSQGNAPNTQFDYNDSLYYYPNYLFNDIRQIDPFITNNTTDDSAEYRYTFHSPDTSFYQPSLGAVLKLETAEDGLSKGHIVQVKDHAKYQFVAGGAYATALLGAVLIGFASGTYGVSVNVFNGTAAMTAYQAMLDIIYKITPKKNFAFQYNAIGEYTHSTDVLNNGFKQRRIEISRYLIPGVEDVGDNLPINNWQRESSVYIKTRKPLPFVSTVSNVIDRSKTLRTSFDTYSYPISSYYASIKRINNSQWGQIYSYETLDTGYQKLLDFSKTYGVETVFGGDIFINKFAYKSKLPFFIDNRVGANDESDISYNELSNIGKVKYWFSTDVSAQSGALGTIFGVKAYSFFWDKSGFFNNNGSIFLFAYGIPYFFCESEVNVDYRQAFNDKEGDFYPHVGTGIPDSWLQEINTTIQQDNTYYYNKTYSRQNQQTNTFTHLPPNFVDENKLPFRAIFSERQQDIVNYQRNNWLVYRPAAKFDFPQNYGSLTSLDGIENKQVLARFENKTLLYNALLTAPTSAADVYLGQSLFSSQVPPLDYADTTLGYIGSQHKFLLKTEYGHITADAKRGQIFLLSNQQVKELTNENTSKFFTEFLNFQIQKAFPQVNVDNHFNGCGLHGVYDPKYNRFLLTKIDYKPLLPDIEYRDNKFYLNNEEIQLTNQTYFCNYSFTISYSFTIQNWCSFHSYIPNYYVGNSSFFYSGINTDSPSLWKHNSSFTLFNNFYNKLEPYIIEHPIYYKGQEEILQDVRDYTRILQYTDFQTFIETDDFYFSHAVLYNSQQCSGTLKLTKKPQNNLQSYGKYPIYYDTEKEILFTKSNSMYQFNTFWSLNKSSQQPIWKSSCQSLSIYKELNNDNMNYSKRAFNKAPLMSKGTNIRLINSTYDNLRFISEYLLTTNQVSYK